MQSTKRFTPGKIATYVAAAMVAEGAYYYFKTRKMNQSQSDAADYQEQENRLDQEIEDSFPASDPPSYGHATARISMDQALS